MSILNIILLQKIPHPLSSFSDGYALRRVGLSVMPVCASTVESVLLSGAGVSISAVAARGFWG